MKTQDTPRKAEVVNREKRKAAIEAVKKVVKNATNLQQHVNDQSTEKNDSEQRNENETEVNDKMRENFEKYAISKVSNLHNQDSIIKTE